MGGGAVSGTSYSQLPEVGSLVRGEYMEARRRWRDFVEFERDFVHVSRE